MRHRQVAGRPSGAACRHGAGLCIDVCVMQDIVGCLATRVVASCCVSYRVGAGTFKRRREPVDAHSTERGSRTVRTRGKRRAGARDDDHDRQADRNLHSLRPGDSRRRPPFRRRPLGRALRRVTGECRGGGQTAKHAIRHRSIGRARFHHHLLGRSGSTHDGSIDADDLPTLRRGGASGRPPGHQLAGRPRWQAWPWAPPTAARC